MSNSSLTLHDQNNVQFKTFQPQSQIIHNQYIQQQQNQQINKLQYPQTINQEEALEQQKLRLQKLSALLNILQNKKQNSNEENYHQKQSISSHSSSSIQTSNKLSRKKSQIAEISISEPIKQNQIPARQSFYPASNSKPKSKFAKQSNFDSEQPYIITSSHKTFFTPSKSNANINIQNNQSSMFLSPGNHAHPSSKQLTSAGNLIQQEQKDQNMNSGLKSNKSVMNQKSSTQVQKTTTFAALPSKRSHQTPEHSAGISLYEEVLAKNFEVIDNLLRKLNQIYSHQEEYQNTITQISQKLHKLQIDNENIHHEFRTSHFMIDKKLNSITNQYSNILQDMNLMKKMWNQSSGMAKGSYFVGLQGNSQDDDPESNITSKRKSGTRKSGTRKSGKGKRNSRVSIFNTTNAKDSFNNPPAHNEPMKSSPRNSSSQRRSTKKSMQMNRKSSNWMNLKGLDEQNLGKVLLEQINESSSWEGSESEQNQSEELLEDGSQERKTNKKQSDIGQFSESMIYDEDSNNSKHNSKNKGNMKSSQKSGKPSKFIKKNQRVSIDSFDYEQISELKNYISQQFIKMSSNAQQLKKFTQLGIETMMTKKCETLEEKIEEKFFQFRKQVLEEKIEKQFRKSIIEQFQEKTIKLIENDISGLRKQLGDKVYTLQRKVNKEIELKCDKEQVRQDLKEILQSMNRKVNTLMDECYHKFAERAQTKRAILFLEKKINKLVQTAQKYNFQTPGQANQNTKCLSCSKNVPLNSPNHFHHQGNSQPMFTQVHLVSSPQRQDLIGFVKDFSLTARKNGSSNENITANKRKVKFTEVTNLNYNSVNEIFDHNNEPVKNSQQSSAINRQSTLTIKPSHDTASSSKETFMKKLKNSHTSDSLHFTSNSNLKNSKILANTQDNRPTTSMNISIHQVSQKNWKQKASSLLKKEANTGVNWRSKSLYKKL